MARRILIAAIVTALTWALARSLLSYPTAPIVGRNTTCLNCHKNTGPWQDEAKAIIEILDPQTGQSLKQKDGSFLIAAKRNEVKSVQMVFGVTGDTEKVPECISWCLVDPVEQRQGSDASNKFAPHWEVNAQYGGRFVGDKVKGYEAHKVVASTMSLRATEKAKDGALVLQVLFPVAFRGLDGNYFEKKVTLKITD